MSKPRRPKAPPARDPRPRPAPQAPPARCPGAAPEPQAKTPQEVIRELQLRQIELEEAHARIQTVLECIPDAFFSLDRAWRFTYVNRAAERLLGLSREQLIGRNIWEMFPSVVGSTIQREFERALAENEATHFEEFYPPFEAWLKTQAYPSAAGLSVYFSNTTASRQAETRLRESEEQLYLALQHSNDAIFWADAETGILLRCNPKAEELTERSRDELIGMHQTQLHPPDRDYREVFRQAAAVPTAENIEAEILSRTGKRTPVVINSSAVTLGRRRIVQAVFRDVTERKRAEEKLKLDAVRLQAQLELHKLMDAPPDQLLDFALEAMTKSTLSQFAFLGFMNPAETVMSVHASKDAMAQCAVATRPMHLTVAEAGLWGECVRQRRPVIVNAYADSPVKKGYPAGHVPMERFLAVPVFDGERIVAVAGAANKGGDFTESDGLELILLTERLWDILRRKRTEEALRQSEEQHRTILETATDGFWLVSTQGRLLEVNESYCRMSGYSAQELLALGISDLEASETADDSAAHLQKIMARGEARFESRHRRKDGSIFDVEVSVQYRPSAGGRFVAFLRDITERQLAADRLRRAHDELEMRVQERTAELRQTNLQLRQEMEIRQKTAQELTEAELRYRTVADFTHDWEYWEAPAGAWRYCSPSCETMTGYSAEEFIADPRLLAQLVHPEDVGLWRNHQQEEALAAPESKIVQFRIRRKDGGIRWVEHACQSVLEKGGAFLGIRASNRDITDRKEEEMQIQMLQKELAHVTRVTTLGQLTASLAHELNQPLTAILCNAQSAERFLASDQPDLTELRETLADIRHDSRRAGGVIQRLRALFHKTGQERSVLQLNDLIKETLGMLRSEFVLKGAALLVELAPELPGVLGNRIELQQVVLNLILNALEAMARLPRSTRQLHISTERESPTLVRASFRDSGPGISEPQLSRLFEPFFTTKPGGMGMGLSICQSIIEAHDGRLWVVNNPDRGATFHFALPLPPRDNA